jgi:RimJ/RimL family protein N-acetyltransferase
MTTVPELRGDRASQRGRGYARNALALLLGYAASIGITRLRTNIATDNHASRRVAESAGFHQESTFTEECIEMTCYSREAPRSSE